MNSGSTKSTDMLLNKAQRRQQGFSLIEVLVTVLILAIGLLGLAGLQSTALRTNHSALIRSQATMLAYDIVERMRSNRTAALNGAYNLALGGTPTGSSIAAQDLTAWRSNLTAVLPSGTGAVAMAAGGRFTITVQWEDLRGEEAGRGGTATKTLSVRTDI